MVQINYARRILDKTVQDISKYDARYKPAM